MWRRDVLRADRDRTGIDSRRTESGLGELVTQLGQQEQSRAPSACGSGRGAGSDRGQDRHRLDPPTRNGIRYVRASRRRRPESAGATESSPKQRMRSPAKARFPRERGRRWRCSSPTQAGLRQSCWIQKSARAFRGGGECQICVNPAPMLGLDAGADGLHAGQRGLRFRLVRDALPGCGRHPRGSGCGFVVTAGWVRSTLRFGDPRVRSPSHRGQHTIADPVNALLEPDHGARPVGA